MIRKLRINGTPAAFHKDQKEFILRSIMWRGKSATARCIRLATQRVVERTNATALRTSVPELAAQVQAMESRLLLSAYTLSQVTAFGLNANGADPQSTLTADPSGNLYGTASVGGPYGAGTVFELGKGSNAITTLASFDGADGADPSGSVLLDGSGNLYGTTFQGGPFGTGVVFEITPGSQTLTTLATFPTTEEVRPSDWVAMDAFGNLYGTTTATSGAGNATVFEIARGSTAATTLASFNGISGASGPTLDSSGNLFGTTPGGGPSGNGTIFMLAKGSTAITTLASFNGTNGADPSGVTLDGAGNLFGTTTGGGKNADGTVFEVSNGSGTITTVASFDKTNGFYPQFAGTLDGSGNLYGTTIRGGANDAGTIFQIANGSNTITTLVSFSSLDVVSGVALDASGNLYGTTQRGGTGGDGSVFEMAAGSAAATTIASFSATNGADAWAGVTLDDAGDLFGATTPDSEIGSGAVFEIAQGSNTTTTIATVSGNLGETGLTLDAAGDIFGTVALDGPGGYGTVFEIANGSTAVTTLASFDDADGSNPSKVTLDASGDLFGTTQFGGAMGYGTIFEIANSSNTITTLASFATQNYANTPSGVTLDASGDIYGTTFNGGTGGYGTVFELPSRSNTIATLASFTGPNGADPNSGVIFDRVGDLFGTTESGGATGNGTAFEIANGSNLITTLASFSGPNGAVPSGLTFDVSGNLYGTTYYGGASQEYGTVFKIGKGSNAITTLASFNGITAGYPHGGVAIDRRGNLYCTTYYGLYFGSASGLGALFELAPSALTALAPADGPNPSTATQPLNFTVSVGGTVGNGEIVQLLDGSNNDEVVATGTLINESARLTIPAGTLLAGTHNLTAVYPGDANFGASESAPYSQVVQVAINGVAVNGNLPALAGAQRSMVDSILYTFSESVNISGAAATLAIHSGQSGTLPTALTWTAINPSSDGSSTQWGVSFSGAGVVGNSIANGVYDITLNSSAVTSDANPAVNLQARPTDTFYRLFGDINGDGVVDAADNFQLKTALATYNAAFDYNDDGIVNAADNFKFKASQSYNFSTSGIVYTI